MDRFATDPHRHFANYTKNLAVLMAAQPEADLHFYLDHSGSLSTQRPQEELVHAAVVAAKAGKKLFVTFFTHELGQTVEIDTELYNRQIPWMELMAENNSFGGTAFEVVWRNILDSGDAQPRINILLSDMQWMTSEQNPTQPENLYYLSVYSQYDDAHNEQNRTMFIKSMTGFNQNFATKMIDGDWDALVADTPAMPAKLRALSGDQWPVVVGAQWDAERSRFASSWHELSHHDQVSIFRLLKIAEREAEIAVQAAVKETLTPAVQPAQPEPDMTEVCLRMTTMTKATAEEHSNYLMLPRHEADYLIDRHHMTDFQDMKHIQLTVQIVDVSTVPADALAEIESYPTARMVQEDYDLIELGGM